MTKLLFHSFVVFFAKHKNKQTDASAPTIVVESWPRMPGLAPINEDTKKTFVDVQ